MTKGIEKSYRRNQGKKGDVFFDSIDYNILFLTQNEFKSGIDLAKELNMAPKNLHAHIIKLVEVGLLDGIMDKSKNQYVFTSYYKLTNTQNEFNFIQDTRTPIQLLNTIKNYIEKQKFNEVMDKLKSTEKTPQIKKK